MSDNNGGKKLSKKQERKKRRKIFLIVEIVLLLFALIALFIYLKFGMINFRDISSEINMDDITDQIGEDTAEALSGYTNIALFGVDNRTNGNYGTGNSDTIMIMSINNDTKEVRVGSVYRDTFLDVGCDGSYFKANAAYARHGGAVGAVKMLNYNMDLDITNYVTVDWKALVNAIDAVGGLEIDVSDQELAAMNKKPFVQEVAKQLGMSSDNVTHSGLQKLNGIQALVYCRIRKGAGDDYARASRQREVLGLLFDKVKHASLTEINALVDGILPQVETSFSAVELIKLATAFKDYSYNQTKGFPYALNTKTLSGSYGGSVVVPCTLEDNVKRLHEMLFDETDYVPSATVTNISQNISYITGFTSDSAIEMDY